MKIPHDPVALEEHFKDNDDGPLSNQGYMPYLNRFILDKVGAKSFCANVFLIAKSKIKEKKIDTTKC